MRTDTLAYALLGAILPVALAAPQISGFENVDHNVTNVAFGQQLQNTDAANHWVAWEEGKDACSLAQYLGVLVEDPCNQIFSFVGNLNLEFRDCDENRQPNALFSDGKFVRTCKNLKHTHTIHCHADTHDVIKRGKCVE